MATDLEKVIRDFKKRFDANSVRKDFTVYLSLGESEDEKYTIWVTAKKAEFKKGKHVEKADCVLKTDVNLFLKMVTENYTPSAMEFLGGKVKTNDVEMLKQFKAVFSGDGAADEDKSSAAKKKK